VSLRIIMIPGCTQGLIFSVNVRVDGPAACVRVIDALNRSSPSTAS